MTKDSKDNQTILVLAKNLRAKMFEKNFNSRTLSVAAKVGRSFIYDILNGQSVSPTITRLRRVAEVLETTVDELTENVLNFQMNEKRNKEKLKTILNRAEISVIACLGYETFPERIQAFNKVWGKLEEDLNE